MSLKKSLEILKNRDKTKSKKLKRGSHEITRDDKAKKKKLRKHVIARSHVETS